MRTVLNRRAQKDRNAVERDAVCSFALNPSRDLYALASLDETVTLT